ncbi:MAG: OmpH family outer membrane protein [Crocinitomicaceae bacterium]|jgi:outer membrane protein|nr:OmpH family outer membrane protein [Crocinitomicaceae bacterium]
MTIKSSYILPITGIILLGIFAFSKGATKSKIGHLHTNALWEVIPEKKSADTVISMKKFELESYFKEKQDDFNTKLQAYVKDSSALTGAIKEQRMQEIISLNKSLEEMPGSFEKDLLKVKEDLYAPIRIKMQAAVDKVSGNYQYDYIFDSSYGTIIYSKNKTDNIMGYVKSELGIK